MRNRNIPAAKSWASLWRRVAHFRYQIRRFLRFSEKAARDLGVTPQQHQLLLGVEGFTGRGWATVKELAEFLQMRHNAVVGLVQRAERKRLVRKAPGRGDRRVVEVHLLPAGHRLLLQLTKLHQRELREFQQGLMAAPIPALPTPRPAGPARPPGARRAPRR